MLANIRPDTAASGVIDGQRERIQQLEKTNAKLLETCKAVMNTIESATVINDTENVLVEDWMSGLHDQVANAIAFAEKVEP